MQLLEGAAHVLVGAATRNKFGTQHRNSYYKHTRQIHHQECPATVEVAGIFVLPRREDYDKMTRDAALDIMKQVCFSSDATLAPVRY